MMNDMNTPSASHSKAWNLIPWLVNGTIGEADRKRVEQHLEQCSDCRHEYALECRIRAGMELQAEDRHDPRPALRELLARVDTDTGSPDAQVHPSAGTSRRQRGWMRFLAAAVVVQSVGLLVMGLALLDHSALRMQQTLDRGAGAYRTLTRTQPGAQMADIRLVPDANMTVAQLQGLLDSASAHIVESIPGSSIYGLALNDDARSADPATHDEQIRTALQVLRNNPGVLLAEPVTRTAGAP